MGEIGRQSHCLIIRLAICQYADLATKGGQFQSALHFVHVKMTEFYPHGSFSITVQDRNLFVDATGPFNKELIRNFDQAMQRCAHPLAGKPWTEVAILRFESAYTPAALDELKASISRRISEQMVAIAIVFIEAESRLLIEHQLHSVLNQFESLSYAFFDDIETASQWCNDQLASLSLDASKQVG